MAIAILITLVVLTANGVSAQSQRGRLTANDQAALITAVAEKIDQIYPFEDVGRETREGILANLRSGAYDRFTSPEEFAARLTSDMESLSHDRHLDLYYNPALAAELLAREGDAQAGPGPIAIERARWENFGFKQLRILDGQIGYLDLRVFFAAKHAGPTAMAAMDFLSRSNAVIIDLRRNGGGCDDMVTLLASYFVDVEEPEVVSASQSTLDGSYYASMLSAFVPGKKLGDIPVYILLSSSTASAAEAFASIMKHLNENVVLVGQTTAGAENPVEIIAIDSEYVLKIPCYRTIYFGARAHWEGKGIAPDVEVEAGLALETAHFHALETLKRRHAGDVAQEMLQWGIDGCNALRHPEEVARTVLESYVGRYRGARIILDGDDLYLESGDGSRKKLLAVSSDTFVVQDRDDMRIRFSSEGDRVVALERIYSDGYRSLTPRD